MKIQALFLCLCLVACGTVRELDGLSPPAEGASLQTVFVATQRSADQLGQSFGTARQTALSFGEVTVSVPPNHQIGRIEWQSPTPDARREFAIVDAQPQDSLNGFTRTVFDQQDAVPGEVLVYVHGFNTTASEAVFRMAQIQEDFALDDPGVLFSWPSAGLSTGYAYDRDSVIYSRDDLVTVLDALTRKGRRVVLVAHSMGSHLAMEALRQARLTGNDRLVDNISAVVLMSPDIDLDVFLRQVEVAEPLPQPFMVLTAEQDRALSLSGLLTGRPRLGRTIDQGLIGRDDIAVFDFSSLADGQNYNHFVPVTSPTAIEFIRSLTMTGENAPHKLRKFLASSKKK
ncbi:alpha/beta hydrolase [Pacificoceanicola onchidii]|uniref:alpha/beta hydrolase n=1 Tax=Pacificoceanicola onchidii TaxID=2562685 RepID=UPI001455E1EE|nr:alpha/beta fold hydrolase [Pacificoceanicola onchidii]